MTARGGGFEQYEPNAASQHLDDARDHNTGAAAGYAAAPARDPGADNRGRGVGVGVGMGVQGSGFPQRVQSRGIPMGNHAYAVGARGYAERNRERERWDRGGV